MYLTAIIITLIIFKMLKFDMTKKLIGFFLTLLALLVSIMIFNNYKNGVYKSHKDRVIKTWH